MKHPNNFRNVGTGPSPYFQGMHRGYGLYQWSIKYYGFENDSEIETAQLWAFGEYSYKTGSFEQINELLGRTIDASIQGRSAGWLVIDSELTAEEISKIDDHVASCMKNLPAFLKDEREFFASEARDAQALEDQTRETLETDLRIVEAMDLIKDVAGPDAVLVVKGIKLI